MPTSRHFAPGLGRLRRRHRNRFHRVAPLEFVLKQQSDSLRMQLQKLNPTTDDGYDELFERLVTIDGELRRLRQGIRSAV